MCAGAQSARSGCEPARARADLVSLMEDPLRRAADGCAAPGARLRATFGSARPKRAPSPSDGMPLDGDRNWGHTLTLQPRAVGT